MRKKYCLFTNDVEAHSIWYNTIRDQTALNVVKEGLPLLLEIYSKYGIRCTFFYTGNIAKKNPNVVKLVLPYGHEIGCHGLSHNVEEAFDVMDFKKQVNHLKISKEILEDLSGQKVLSFRAPALRVNKYTPLALAETGFKIDSSIASQRFDMFLSFGGIKKLKWLFAPRIPYRTQNNNLFRSGNGPIIEVPISAFLFPYIGTTLRMMPKFIRLLRHMLHLECNVVDKPIVFDIHPNEFLNEDQSEEEKRVIERRTKDFFSYIFADLLRSRLKIKNLGSAVISLYGREVEFFFKNNYKFMTLKDYVNKLEFRL